MAHAIASQRIKRGRIILTPNENLGTDPAPRQTSQSRQQAAFIREPCPGVLERQQNKARFKTAQNQISIIRRAARYAFWENEIQIS